MTIGLASTLVLAGCALKQSAVEVGATDPEYLYLLPNDDWKSAGARFAAYFFQDDTHNHWSDMTELTTDAGTYRVEIPSTYNQNVIFCRMNGSKTENVWDNKWNQTADLTVSGNVGKRYEITGWDNSGKWESDPFTPTVPTDVPAEDGYYIVGTKSNWHYDGATKMDAGSEGYKAEKLNYAGGANEEFKARSYLNEVDTWYGVNNNNYSVGATAKQLDVYVANSGELEVVEHHVYQYSLNGAAAVTMTKNPGSLVEYTSASVSFKVGDELTFTKDGAAYVVAPEDDNLYTKVEANNSKLVFVQDYTGSIYLKTDTNKLWAGEIDSGFYLNGSFSGWDVKHAIKAEEKQDEAGTYVAEITTTVANVEVKFIEMAQGVKAPDYKNIDSNKLTIADDARASLGEGDAPNIKLEAADRYVLYFNSTNGWYSVTEPNYEPIYTVKVGSATPVAVTLNKNTEYQTAELDLTAGETIAVYKGGVATTEFAVKMIGNNNIDADKKVQVSTHDRVYIDINAKTIFVGGLEFGGYHALVNGAFVEMTKNETPDDPTFREYSSGLMDFKKDDVVRFIDTTGGESGTSELPVIFDITKINEYSEAGCFAAVEGHLVAQKDCEVSVYLKLKSGADEVYFGPVSQAVQEAAAFAKAFNTAIEGVCKTDNTTSEAALKTAWQNQVTEFGKLSEAAQAELKAATKTHNVDDIAAFIAKYEYVASKYGTKLGDGYNFLEKTLPVGGAVIYGNQTISSETNVSMIAIISVIALVSVASVVTIVVIKKKSHN